MILTLDVGNTNIKCALYEDEELKNCLLYTSDAADD